MTVDTLKAPVDAVPTEASARLVQWWGETMAVLDEIRTAAHAVAAHARAEGDPLEGRIDARGLDCFADRLGDLITSGFGECPPLPQMILTDPIAGAVKEGSAA